MFAITGSRFTPRRPNVPRTDLYGRAAPLILVGGGQGSIFFRVHNRFFMKSSDNGFIRVIAVFKVFKALSLVALGAGAFRLIHRDIGEVLEHWFEALKLDPGNLFLDAALSKASTLSPAQIKKLGIGSFIYAGLFLTEGLGLWFLKRWAEWLTVIITSSLIPLEIFEIHRHPSIAKVLLLAINLVVVAYLIYRMCAQGKDSN